MSIINYHNFVSCNKFTHYFKINKYYYISILKQYLIYYNWNKNLKQNKINKRLKQELFNIYITLIKSHSIIINQTKKQYLFALR